MNELEIEAGNEDAWRALVLNNGTFDSIAVTLSNGDRIEICSTWSHQIAADYHEEGESKPTALRDLVDGGSPRD